jgi:hypothetical protein
MHIPHSLPFTYFFTFLIITTPLTTPNHIQSHSAFLAGIDNPSPSSSHKSISIPFEITDFHQIIITVCLGTPRNCYPFKLATNMNECYILHKDLIHFGYDDKASSTFQSHKDSMWFEVQHQMLHGEIVSDTLTIPSTPIELDRFVFYLIKQEDGLKTVRSREYVGVLGLGKKYEDYAMSFMSQLYLTDHIDDQMFSLTYKPSTSNGYLTIGYHDYINTSSKILPTQLGNSNHNYRVVPIEETLSPSFEVKMNAIIYNNDLLDNSTRVFSNTQTVLFSPGANHIYCPTKFYTLLVNVVFNDVINKGSALCWSERSGDYERIKCKNDILTETVTLGDIRFIFTKWNVKIALTELFDECGGDDYEYMCFAIVNIISSEQWVMGYHFLKKYPIIFDADDYKIALKIK